MARKFGDVCFPTGKYLDRETNEEKTSWMKVGVVIETDRGLRIKLDAVPVVTGDNGLWMSVFTEGGSSGSQQKPAQNRSEGFRDKPKQQEMGSEDDVPF